MRSKTFLKMKNLKKAQFYFCCFSLKKKKILNTNCQIKQGNEQSPREKC